MGQVVGDGPRIAPRRRAFGLAVATAAAVLWTTGIAGGATGDLTYEGCITGETESGPAGSGACDAIGSAFPIGTSSGLDNPQSVTVSSDGASVYVAVDADSAIAHFSRDPGTGALEYKGCITGEIESGPPGPGSGACAAIGSASSDGENSGLDGVNDVAVSADGSSVYALSFGDDAVARFNRDPATGALTYKGCITGETNSGKAGSGACKAIGSASSFSGFNSGLDSPRSIAVSADGASVYVVSEGDDAVARFARDPATGKLVYQDCITGEIESGPAGSGACKAIGSASAGGSASGLDGAGWMAQSPDGTSLYVAAQDDDSIARFSHDAATGKLAYKGCITGDTESGPARSGACDVIGSATAGGASSGLDAAVRVTVSADGASLYASSRHDDAIARFARNTTSGKLKYKGCVTGETQSGPAGSGACTAIGSATASGANSGLDLFTAEVAVSSDGASLYTIANGDDAIARFARNTTSGKLKYKGCITGETESGPSGSGACEEIASASSGGLGSGLDSPSGLELSPDGASLYGVTFHDTIATFTRTP